MKISCGGLIVCPSTNRMLLNLRAEHKTHPLNWSLWGGMSFVGETTIECLNREISEEIGFLPEFLRVFPFDVYQSRDKNFKYYSFVCVVQEEFIPILNSESDGYGWFTIGKWPRPLHSGARYSFLSSKANEKLMLITETTKKII